MKVILLQDVKDQGKKGMLIDVSDGYARNYLLPRKLATPATPDALNAYKITQQAKISQAAFEKQQAQELADRLGTLEVVVQAKGGPNGRLFGSVTSAEICAALLSQHHVKLDKHKLVLAEPLKNVGDYSVVVKLGHEVSGALRVTVQLAQ